MDSRTGPEAGHDAGKVLEEATQDAWALLTNLNYVYIYIRNLHVCMYIYIGIYMSCLPAMCVDPSQRGILY